MRIVLSLVVKFPRARIPLELGALATNLTFVRENCEKLANAANGKGLHMLVKRMCKHLRTRRSVRSYATCLDGRTTRWAWGGRSAESSVKPVRI